MSGTDPNIVGIAIGKNSLYGWQDVKVTLGIERFPSDFTLRLTEVYPGTPTQISIAPGDPCKVTLGGDTILTGYVDLYTGTISGSDHQVTVSGRGMCQDLVDCSAKLTNFSANSITMVGLAKLLAKPFGITVLSPDGDSDTIPTFSVTLTETPYEILEHIARWASFLVYENTSGNLVIGKLADTKMASGIVQGQNVQDAHVTYSTAERYTEIDPVYLATTFLLDNTVPPLGSSAPVIPYIPKSSVTDSSFPQRSDGQPRYRPLIVVSPQTQNSTKLAQAYAAWMMARRVGRSQQLHVTVDSWRDSAGKLWQPNSLAPINIPSLKLVNQTWLISEVTFARGENGTTAELILMPKEAFAPQKEVLVPFDWQIGTTPNSGAAASRPTPN